MIRSALAMLALATAMLLASIGVSAGAADAQICTSKPGAGYSTILVCEDPGRFTNSPASASAAATGPADSGAADSTVDDASDAAAGAAADAPKLAFTGADNDVLVLAGSGLIAAGAFVLTARRRLERNQG